MGILFIFLGTLFLNSCLHGFQKLNYYDHIFKSYLQVFGFFPSTSILMW
jgi:hypothetical protein